MLDRNRVHEERQQSEGDLDCLMHVFFNGSIKNNLDDFDVVLCLDVVEGFLLEAEDKEQFDNVDD